MASRIFGMPYEKSLPTHSIGAGRDLAPELFPLRISNRYPRDPIGKDFSFRCDVVGGGTFYCKDDGRGRPIRQTEWFATRLAEHLSVSVPTCRVIEDEHGNTFFGSMGVISTAGEFDVRRYLTQPRVDELGRISDWLGRNLSGLYAYDFFLNNPDRRFGNFVLDRDGFSDRLCAIDFADARLEDISTDRFPVATSHTVCNGKILQSLHGFYADSALEMVDRIAAVPTAIIRGIVEEMPLEWVTNEQRDRIYESWSCDLFDSRLSALRAVIRNRPP